MDYEWVMQIAIKEARTSLCEGNHGFGAVVVKDGEVIASAHDREVTEDDPTSHAELNAIREASHLLGRDLSACILISTHEPCPMCASAIVWAKIKTIGYGYSIKNALAQGRERIDFSCAEVFNKAGADIKIIDGLLEKECSILYRKEVRQEIKRLRHADEQALLALNADSICRRLQWYAENKPDFGFISSDLLASGYRLLLERFKISPLEAPVIQKTDKQILFHSQNFCPTLEACKILGLDTRYVCKRINENSTDALLKQIDPRL